MGEFFVSRFSCPRAAAENRNHPHSNVAPATPKELITTKNVHVDQALKTPQFYLLWEILCLNVTAGIGVLGQASAMSQEMFHGSITPLAARIVSPGIDGQPRECDHVVRQRSRKDHHLDVVSMTRKVEQAAHHRYGLHQKSL